MKTTISTLIAFALISTSLVAQEVVVKALTPAQVRLQNQQKFAEDVWEEQDRQREEMIERIPQHLWTMKDKKSFTGKFIELKSSRALIQRKLDGKMYNLHISTFSAADQKYIRDEVSSRKGIVKKTVTKK